MKKARIKFSKTGLGKYISHLDTSRVFSRALECARAPVWYTEGFNSRIYMTFALPLALGIESNCELMDFRFADDDYDGSALPQRLNEYLPDCLQAHSCYEPQLKPALISWARYSVSIADTDSQQAAAALRQLLDAENIEVMKRTKRGEKLTDIKPLVRECDVIENGESCDFEIVCRAGNEVSLNPRLLAQAAEAKLGREFDRVSILRTAMLCADGSEFR